MTQYVVIRNTLSENFEFEKNYKCHKIRKSSGKLLYKITKKSSDLYLRIENIVVTKRTGSEKNVAGTVAPIFNLTDILEILQPNTVAGSAAKLLPFLGDNNNAGFVTAVLVDLGLVRIK